MFLCDSHCKYFGLLPHNILVVSLNKPILGFGVWAGLGGISKTSWESLNQGSLTAKQ